MVYNNFHRFIQEWYEQYISPDRTVYIHYFVYSAC